MLIPIDDHAIDLLRDLDAAAERTLRGWIDDINRITSARPQKAEVERIAAIRDVHPNTVYNMLKRAKTHGLAGLIDRRKQRPTTTAITIDGHRSPLFREYVQNYYRKFDRNNAGPAVYAQILSDWRRWLKDPYNPALRIPGYLSPPTPDPKVKNAHPRGWSRRSIHNLAPNTIDIALSRRGPQSANLLFASIATTRVGLQVGQIFMFDDQEYDNYVLVGQKATRPLGLMGIDVFSGKIVASGYKPAQGDQIKGEKKLNARDTMWFIVHLLTSVGYLDTGTMIVCESGTGSISDAFAARIGEATNGSVKVDRGEVSKEKVRGLKGLARGNPRHKPGMESLFNLLRNSMGLISAPTGRNPQEQHEGTVALIRQDEKVIAKAAQHLPADRLNDLRLKVLPWDRFVPVAEAVNGIINANTEHHLEGWKALGFETIEYLVGTEYANEAEFAALPPETQALVLHRIETQNGIIRSRKLSRDEVFRSGEKHLRKLDPFRWHLLIPQEFALTRKVPSDGELIINDQTIDPSPIIFESWMLTTTADDRPVPPGKTVLLYLNPYDTRHAIICDTDRNLLGLIRRKHLGTRLDEEPLRRQHELRQKTKTHLGSGAKKYDDTQARQNADDAAYNQAIIETGEAPIIDITPEATDTPERRPKTAPPLDEISYLTPTNNNEPEWSEDDLPDLY